MAEHSENQKAFARRLRGELTPAEKILWKHLRDRCFAGFKFRRQHPIGPYIVDFCCISTYLIIEIDGEIHLGREVPDQKRQQYLEAQKFRMLRFWNNEVFDDLEAVLERIYQHCQAASRHPSPPTPLPSRQGRGEEEAASPTEG